MSVDPPDVGLAKRELSWRDAAFVVLCVLAVGLVFSLALSLPFEALGSPDRGPRYKLAVEARQLPATIWLLLALLPVAAMVIYRQPRHLIALVRCLAAGLTGASLVGLGLMLAVVGVADPAIQSLGRGPEDIIFSVIVLAEAGIFTGLGAAIWAHGLQIVIGRSAAGSGVVAGAVTGAAFGMCVALLFVVKLVADELATATRDHGALMGAGLAIGLGAVWLFVFSRLARLDPAPAWRSLMSIAALAVIIVISFIMPAFLADSRGWAPLVAVVAVPVSAVIAVFIGTAGTMGLRAFLTPR